MLFGLLVAIVVSRIDGTAWPGVPLAFAATGLLVAAGHQAHRITEFRAARGLRRLGAMLIVVVAFATPLAAAALWVTRGADGPLRGDLSDPVPVLAALQSAPGEGTLLLRPKDGRVTYTLMRGRAPLIGESDLESPREASDRFTTAVAGLASGRGSTYVQTLAASGVRFVTVPGPVDPALQRALDSQPDLVRISLSETGGLWRVADRVTVPAAPAVPGTLHRGWLWAQGGLLVLVLILASPGARTKEPESDYDDVPVEEGPRGRRRTREDRVPA